MERPICRLCGAKHYSNEPHIIKVDLDAVYVEPPIVKEVVFSQAQNPKSFAPDPGSGVVDLKPKFDRNAYQREYMREWRVKQRDKKS